MGPLASQLLGAYQRGSRRPKMGQIENFTLRIRYVNLPLENKWISAGKYPF